MDCTRFGNKLNYYREKNDMTQKELARKLGISVRKLEKLENSEVEPSIRLVNRISNVFGVDFQKYLDLDEKHSGKHRFDEDDPEFSPLGSLKTNRKEKPARTRTANYDRPVLKALIGPYVAFALPMSVFVLVAFMKTIPKELEEAAEIDGCGRFRNFFMIILPLSKPGLATLAIYNGVAMWNEFAFANTLLKSPANKTLPLALGQFKGEHALDIPIILSVLTLSVLPMIILFIIFQNKLVKGMMAGAVKG